MTRGRRQLAPLYERLPHGPNGMPREEVARHQRARIHGAMIESVSLRGYRATTVADVIALAGVSRRAFYEHFANKQDCFLRTHDLVVAGARKRVIGAWRRQRGWGTRLHASCSTLLGEIAGSPKGPRLVLVEALCAGQPARARMQLAGAAFEQLVSRVLGDAPHGGRPAPLAPRAIVGGIWQIAFARLIEGREGELPGMTEELLDWMHSYMFAPGLGLPSPAPAAARPRPQVRFAYLADGTDRGRALAALVRLIRSDGYESLGDARIADDAGITIEAFHDHFASRDACLYALLDGLSDELQGPLADAAHLAGGWPEYVRSALAGLLEHLAGREDLMRVAFLDALDAGPAAAARMMRVVGRLVTRLCQEAPRPRLGGAVASEAVSGALLGVISSCCARGLQRQLPALVDHLSFLVLAPYLGARAAATAIRRS